MAVVYATLLHMNDGFKEVGFGSWMPFRFPDQWLSFCGIMRRVLAANGLIHSEHAESYRKLLEETPEPESSGEGTDRVRETQTPGNLASGHENRGVNNMTELQTLLQGEIWKPEKPPPRKQYAR